MGRELKRPSDRMDSSRGKPCSDAETTPYDLYRAVFYFTPLAIFVVDRNFQIIDSNNRFKQLYPNCECDRCMLCYRVIPSEERDTPCPDCLVRKTFLTGMGATAEEKIVRNGYTRHYRKETAPLYGENGEIVAVMEILADVTEKVEAGLKLEKYTHELETAISIRSQEQQEKEKKFTLLVNTVSDIKGAHNITESIDRLVCAYKELGARAIMFTLHDEGDMQIVKVFPQEVLSQLNFIFHTNLTGKELNSSKNPQNPFVNTMNVGKPVFYKGEKEIFSFFKTQFSGSFDHEIAEAAYLFHGWSQVIFPLKTKDAGIGAIAVAAEIEILEQNFEYLSFLSNSAAVEILRQRNSEKLIKSELNYRNLVESSRDMIILCMKDGKIKYSNRIFYELTGITNGGRKELNIFSFFSALNRERMKNVISASIMNGANAEPIEIQMKTPGRGDLWTEMIINRVSGEESSFQIVARDISRRKNLEILVGNLSAFQEKILQNDFIGIITTDLSGKITTWNKGASHILGFQPKEAVDRYVSEFVIETDDTSSRFLKRDITGSSQNSWELKFKRKDAEPINVMYVESSMKDDSDKPIAVIAFFFDNTEKVRLEEKWKELTFRLQQAQLITIVSLAKLAEYRDIETGQHLERIMKYTELIARELAKCDDYRDYITDEYIIDLVNSCPLHDIGKVGIPDMILHKPGRLTKEEFEIIKKHSIIGGDTIAEAERKVHGRSYLNLGKEIAYYHHEKWDGNGYPSGLKGKQIPLSARIVAVADVYDALISKRPYKEAYPHEVARDIIIKSAHTHFDDTVVKAFLRCEQDMNEPDIRQIQ